MKLAIIKKWDTSFDGDTRNIRSSINYLNTKNFIIYSWNINGGNDVFVEDFKEFISIYNYIKKQNDNYKLTIINDYNYIDRDFCNVNYNFEYFLKKCKKYYSQKLNYYKSPKSIIYRQRCGQFSFKFNNV
tara:strand:- start:700 stop:1089 length:390 start_codon:yes stop_codon:yes gene_type:complete